MYHAATRSKLGLEVNDKNNDHSTFLNEQSDSNKLIKM